MIQDIWPKHLDNQYKNLEPGNEDTVFYFQGSSLLARPSGHFNLQNSEENVLIYPQYDEFVQGIKSSYGDKAVDNFEFIYLLSIDEEHFSSQERREASKEAHSWERWLIQLYTRICILSSEDMNS